VVVKEEEEEEVVVVVEEEEKKDTSDFTTVSYEYVCNDIPRFQQRRHLVVAHVAILLKSLDRKVCRVEDCHSPARTRNHNQFSH